MARTAPRTLKEKLELGTLIIVLIGALFSTVTFFYNNLATKGDIRALNIELQRQQIDISLTFLNVEIKRLSSKDKISHEQKIDLTGYMTEVSRLKTARGGLK